MLSAAGALRNLSRRSLNANVRFFHSSLANMVVKVGDRFPDGELSMMKDGAPKNISTKDFFAGKKVALFAVPGAFTPTCSQSHLPGFIKKAQDFKTEGIDEIVCLATNDVFVMDAWGRDQGVEEKILMVADGGGDITRKLGLTLDTGAFGGVRSKRYAMLVDDGVIKELDVDEKGLDVSSADALLCKLKK